MIRLYSPQFYFSYTQHVKFSKEDENVSVQTNAEREDVGPKVEEDDEYVIDEENCVPTDRVAVDLHAAGHHNKSYDNNGLQKEVGNEDVSAVVEG